MTSKTDQQLAAMKQLFSTLESLLNLGVIVKGDSDGTFHFVVSGKETRPGRGIMHSTWIAIDSLESQRGDE